MSALRLAVIGGVLAFLAPALAGLGGAGGWSIGLFALILVARLMLTTQPEAWATPQRLALAVAVNAVAAALMWGLGRGISALTGWTPGWNALPPLVLGIAAAAFSIVMFRNGRAAAGLARARQVPRPVDDQPRPGGNRAERRRKASNR